MSRTDRQGCLRRLLNDLEEIRQEEDEDKREAKLVKTIEYIRDALENCVFPLY